MWRYLQAREVLVGLGSFWLGLMRIGTQSIRLYSRIEWVEASVG